MGKMNQLKFSKGKCRVLPLGRNNPLHWDKLGAELLESSSAEKDLEILVDSKLSTSQQRPCGQEANDVLRCIRKSIPSELIFDGSENIFLVFIDIAIVGLGTKKADSFSGCWSLALRLFKDKNPKQRL
ncbi:hypothetical protein TURU_054178 [Turdus rufiventris]|nr:hypothetical protein TURU_054178 [Turdus rufiventris]